jgi:hypothetical protein
VPVSVMRKSDDRVVIAVDPHKASWTAAVQIDSTPQRVISVLAGRSRPRRKPMPSSKSL